MKNRKEITQEKILRASMELFAARGYDKTSISAIANRAEVSRTSIFWHFSDKETLFGETCRHFLMPFRESLEFSSQGGHPRERLISQIAAYQDFVFEHRATIRSFLSWAFGSQPQVSLLLHELLALHRDFCRRLETEIRELIGTETNTGWIASTMVAALHGNMLLRVLGVQTERTESAAEQAQLLVEWLRIDDR